MRRKRLHIMNKSMFKKFIYILIVLSFFSNSVFGQGVIIDHTCTDLGKVPDAWLNAVKSNIKLHYARRSHGGQLIVGIERMADLSLPEYDPRLKFTRTEKKLPQASNLCIMDGQLHELYVISDLYWRKGGDKYTRATLDAYPAINVSMFTWCTELGHYSEPYLRNAYLHTIEQLEKDYPQVTFIYCTGNAQRTGEEGYVRYLRNEQIRKFCRENNKVLYDFGDLDAWYNGEHETYLYNGVQVPSEHPHYHGSETMHTTFESCVVKGKALWWMLARIAGWTPSECDYNSDGTADRDDLIGKQRDVLQNYDTWIQDCWRPSLGCGDFNRDGSINHDDIESKRKALAAELIVWMTDCDYNKKTIIKR